LLPVGWWHLVLLQEVHAHISFVDLGATDDPNLGVHDHIVGDGERLKALTKHLDFLRVVLVEHVLFLWAIFALASNVNLQNGEGRDLERFSRGCGRGGGLAKF